MKGIVLAGGYGTRLKPLTKVTNKHLIRVYDKPMIDYSIDILLKSGIDDIMIILGGESVGDMVKYLGSGKNYNARFTYRYQDEAGGIAQAIGLSKGFVNDKFLVVLGDNVLGGDIDGYVKDWWRSESEACIFVKETDRPEEFGILEYEKIGNIFYPKRIIEKPKDGRKTGEAVIGVYGYSVNVFDCVESLKPSARGELEVTDINNWYLCRKQLSCYSIDGWWHDCGDVDALIKTSELLSKSN